MTDQTQGAAGALTSPPPAPAFFESFQNAEVKDWASKGGFKSAEDVAALARKFDAFKDADPASLAKLPGADAKPEEHLSLLERLGAPKDAASYGLDKLENVDKALAAEAQGWFKDAGLLPWQAQLIAQKQMEWQSKAVEAQIKEGQAASEREHAALKAEWGSEYAAKIELGKRALSAAGKAAGIDGEAVKAVIADVESMIGTKDALKLFSFFGKFIKEGDFVDGHPQGQGQASLLQRLYPKDVAKG